MSPKCPKLGSLLCLSALPITLFVAPVLAAETAEENDVFEMSLDELGKIDISGKAIRDLELASASVSENWFDRSLFDLPFSIDVMSSDTLRARGIRNVVEAAENLPGVISGEAPAEPYSFSMRGFTRDSVRILFDGISIGSATLNMRPQGSDVLERIELIRGAVALHGVEGGAAGALNFVTPRAVLKSRSDFSALIAAGSYGAWRGSFNRRAQIDENKAYFVAGDHQQQNGWIDDTSSQSSNLVADFLWQLSADVDLHASINHLDDELPAYWGTPLLPASVARRANRSPISTVDGRVIDESIRFRNYNVSDHKIASTSDWIKSSIEAQLTRQWQHQTTAYAYRADRDWQNAESYSFDIDAQQIGRDRLLVIHDRKLTGIVSRFVFDDAAHAFNPHFALSVELSRNRLARQVGFDIDNPDPYVDFVDVQRPQPGLFGEVDRRRDFTDAAVRAIVLDDSIVFNEEWSLSLSYRHEKLHFDRERFNFAGALQPARSLDKTFSTNGGRVGLTWRPSAAQSFYAHHSKQHDTFEGDISYLPSLQTYQPPSVSQSELGWKSKMVDGRVSLSAAIFDIKRYAYTGTLAPQGLNNTQVSEGVELALSANAGDAWHTGINATRLRARYEHFYDFEYRNDVSNNRPANTPQTMVNWWLSYDRVAALPLEMGLGWNYVGDRFADALNTVRLNAYETINLFAAYTQPRYRLALHLRNVTDRLYVPWSDTVYPNQVSLGPPRTVELSFQWQF